MIQGYFATTACVPFDDPLEVISVQAPAFLIVSAINFFHVTLYLVMLPKKLRSRRSLQVLHWLYLLAWLLPAIGALYWGISLWPTC